MRITPRRQGFAGTARCGLLQPTASAARSAATCSAARPAALPLDEDVVVWLGHSSYFVQIAGRTLLIDPVFCEGAAPVPYVNAAFR